MVRGVASLLALTLGALAWTGCSSTRPADSAASSSPSPDLLRIRRLLDSGIVLQSKGRYAPSQAKLAGALSELSLVDTGGQRREAVEALAQQILGAMKNNLPYSLDLDAVEETEAYEEDGLALIDSLLSDSIADPALDSASAARMWREIQGDSGVSYDLPVEVNELVLLHLRTFQERLPQHFARWIERKGRWEAMITRELEAHGLPKDLLYLAMIESGFNPRATSPAAAAGIWQFIPATGRRFGLRIDRFVDERRDPWKSTQAAIQYLSVLYQMFGDWKLAMASYNCGENCVNRAIRRAGTADYWSLPIPRETRNYVPRVFAAAILGKNPKAHGFDLTPWDPVVVDTFTVEGGLTFQQIGDALGVPADSIAVLNPALTRGTTPPLKESWVLNLPQGRRERFAEVEPSLERSYQAPQPQRFTYKVRRKQSVASIAARFGVSAADVRRWNRISSRTKTVRAGRQLVIWGDSPGMGVAVREPPLRSGGDGIPERTAWKIKSHKVRRGESLASIARRYGVAVEQLVEWNGLSSGKVKSGKRIYVSAPSEGRSESIAKAVASIPSASGAARLQALTEDETGFGDESVAPSARKAAPPVFERPRTHRVRNGETLTSISARYRVGIQDLRTWNRLASDRLRPGVRIRLHGEDAPEAPARPARTVRLSGDPRENPVAQVHRVVPGETLESIAQRYGVAISSLKVLNGLRGSRILAGQKLSIPGGGAKAAAAGPEAVAEPVRKGAAKSGTMRYVVREGDSLYSIARERATTVDTLMELNGLRNAGIRAGQVIQVPVVASR